MNALTAGARNQFDRWSRSYDRSLLQHVFFGPSHRMLLDALGPGGARRVLDIGCGTGVFAARVLERFPETEVWGLDLSPGMLRKCLPRRAAAAGRFHLVQGDCERLPFADDAFDVVTSTHSFHHYPHQRQAVAEMHRVLRPGGRLFIIDGDPDRLWGHLLFDVLVVLVEGPVRHLKGRAFRELFAEAGFVDVRQQRRRGLIPFVLTTGQALKAAAPALPRRARAA